VSDLIVRKAELADAAAVAEMMTGLNFAVGVGGLEDPYDKLPENAIFSPELTARRMTAMQAIETPYVAYVDGATAGFMSLRLCPYLDQDEPYAEVMNLFVAADYRRSGVARALVAKAEEVAREAGATVLRIITGVDNHNAQAFYRAAGYFMPGVLFEKYLTQQPEVAAR